VLSSRANRLLERFEQIWQARIGRLDELLANSNQGERNAGC
jgi:hypothetical protein